MRSYLSANHSNINEKNLNLDIGGLNGYAYPTNGFL